MHIIKLDATDSTNTYLKNRLREHNLDDFTTVVTHKQLSGKGQMGAVWESQPGKNLTFSTLKKFNHLSVTNAFLLNICTSLAVSNALKQYSVPNLHVKWPNDILSGNTKICGILVENILVGKQIKTTIIGIGLNVNQTIFRTVSNATSMKLLLGRTLNLDEVRNAVMNELWKVFSFLEEKEFDLLRYSYHQELFRKDKPSTFKSKQGGLFTGFIRGVSTEGKLRVELEGAVLKEYDLKEVQLLY
jgi:BirA family biotin operon repressor/biotin-[acetyl-CoA-carboxylase] ligase